uniref:Splicing factor 3A putative n=1 Tax=Albugo laibachii Nc14 TaxID=890382 RepID=F0W4M0_9STRA|nr:splicing factor 3A putative [Albugo laibachii Nc14]|eukprot:CCA16054.1 splicing factor 3A putative [Albugo laibachii Nc14]
MSATSLEQLRSTLEDAESYERLVVSILQEKSRNHRERVLHGLKVSALLDRIVSLNTHAKALYDDKDGTFTEESSTMRGRATFTSFYEQIKHIRTFHRKYPNTPPIPHEPDVTEVLHPQVNFSGEERFGRYVDLHQFYTQFMNIPAFQRKIKALKATFASNKSESRRKRANNERHLRKHVDYLTYLSCFYDFSMIELKDKRSSAEYHQHINDLKQYLLDFYRRTQPLVDLDDVIDETRAKFEKQWALNELPGWQNIEVSTKKNHKSSKDAKDQLYCSFCDKCFASDGVYKSHLNGKKHKKATYLKGESNVHDSKAISSKYPQMPENSWKEIAFNEVLVRRMHELLTEVIHATIAYLEMKQTRTAEELQAEIEEEQEGVLSDIDAENTGEHEDDDEEDTPFYNPLNLPLGWDGKPIPYWLYKLHGLGVEYKCEICGNHSYWGRRAFDRHFQEWRHAFGMRCLKIPNTKHFHDITRMQDAIQLYEKLKDQIDAETWNPSAEEEFEDSEGNVLNRKTFEDLARQGLL